MVTAPNTPVHTAEGRRVLALWSAPRSRSTAFFRMMLQRADFFSVHEPFSTRAEFGAVDLGGTLAVTETEVMHRLRSLSEARPVFFKDTTDERYATVLSDEKFLAEDVCSTFIIRHPAETLPSYYATNPDVRCHQIGIEHQYEMFSLVWRLTGALPLVIDSADLIAAPEATTSAYFDLLGLPYVPEALSWPAGDRPEWRATARWHRDVASTTGFADLPAGHGVRMADLGHLAGCLEYQLPFYEKLHQYRLRLG
ncbi:sulfotransferase family protein [Amycolatopsis magusensis]|uniref:Sulfotransferase family protein n=1 Tax=Amycolatopsis magusensis TaxID=882444 RepID=A0ABS4PVQ1_9PSEU|nr:sulfotransferase family protein [Amycolatopsis magusensis]MBP2182934.1 hypothetical protein [Amycolatopsis magusensis]